MRLRPATDDDRDDVLALGVLEEHVWFGEAELSAEEVGEWVDEEGGVAGGVAAIDAGGRVRAFASPGLIRPLFVADPAETDAAIDLLVPWLRERRDPLELMTFAGDGARVRAFERHGLSHRRSSFEMTRNDSPLPVAEFPDGVTVAPYQLGDDDEAVHRLIYVDAAWASIPGHADRDLGSWRASAQPCRVRLLARRDDNQPIGWVAGRVLDSGRGYVVTLAVAQGERGRGLGRALLLHAFADLQAAGAHPLSLDVEAGNENALGLYRSVGLEIVREWRFYAASARS
jgi:ribosomal protein S18 acetylase RimI-like enzyme